MDKLKLEMEFIDEADKKFTIRLDEPREDLTGEEVSLAMENIISNNVFASGSFDLKAASEARIVTTSINKLDF